MQAGKLRGAAGPAERERGILVRCRHGPRLPATAAQTPRPLCVFPLTGEESTHTSLRMFRNRQDSAVHPILPRSEWGTVGRAQRGSSTLRLAFSAGGLRSLDQPRSECEAPSAPLVSRRPVFPPKGIAAPPGDPLSPPLAWTLVSPPKCKRQDLEMAADTCCWTCPSALSVHPSVAPTSLREGHEVLCRHRGLQCHKTCLHPPRSPQPGILGQMPLKTRGLSYTWM